MVGIAAPAASKPMALRRENRIMIPFAGIVQSPTAKCNGPRRNVRVAQRTRRYPRHLRYVPFALDAVNLTQIKGRIANATGNAIG